MIHERVRQRLQRVFDQTLSADSMQAPAMVFDDNKADERRRVDDLSSSRHHWQMAHRDAGFGLDALDRGDADQAESFAWSASHFYILALEDRVKLVRPSDIAHLDRPAKRRGRPPKSFPQG